VSRFANLVRGRSPLISPQIFVNADERERHRAAVDMNRRPRQALSKQFRRQHLKTALARLRHTQPQRPQRVTLAILRADLLQPAPVEAHEVAEAPALAVEGVVQECGVGGACAPGTASRGPTFATSAPAPARARLSSVQ